MAGLNARIPAGTLQNIAARTAPAAATAPGQYTPTQLQALGYTAPVQMSAQRTMATQPPPAFMRNAPAGARLRAWQAQPQVQQQMNQATTGRAAGQVSQGLANQTFASPNAAAQDALIKFNQIQAMGTNAPQGVWNATIAQYQKALQQGATPIPALDAWAQSRMQQVAQDNKMGGMTSLLNAAVPAGLALMTGGALAGASGLLGGAASGAAGGAGSVVGGAGGGMGSLTGAAIDAGIAGGSQLGLGSAGSMMGLGGAATGGLGTMGLGLTGGAATALGGAGTSAAFGGAASSGGFLDSLGNWLTGPGGFTPPGGGTPGFNPAGAMIPPGLPGGAQDWGSWASSVFTPKNLLSVGSGLYGMVQGNQMMQQAQQQAAAANPWGTSGGYALAGQQLQNLLRNPGQVAATDPAYQLRIQGAQRAMAGAGQDSGAMAVAAANASSDWYNQRLAQLGGLAGANLNPAQAMQVGQAGQQAGVNLMGQGMASMAYPFTPQVSANPTIGGR